MGVLGTRDAVKVSEKERHGFLGVHEINDFLVFPTLTDIPFQDLLIINRTFVLFNIIVFNHVLSTYCAKGASTLMEDQGDSLFQVECLLTVVTK